jgi:hypothetical protein
MVEDIVIDPATQPFAGSVARAKGWRFNACLAAVLHR